MTESDTFSSPGAVTPEPSVSRSGLSAGAVIGIVVIVFIIFLIIVDVSCYFMNSCGVLHCCCVQLCGKGAAGSKEKAMEEGERCVKKFFFPCFFFWRIMTFLDVGGATKWVFFWIISDYSFTVKVGVCLPKM